MGMPNTSLSPSNFYELQRDVVVLEYVDFPLSKRCSCFLKIESIGFPVSKSI